MPTVEQVIDDWTVKLQGDPEMAQRLSAAYKFVIEGEGGGTWVFNCKEPVTVSKGEGEADCTVKIQSADLLAIANGDLNPQAAFMEGRLEVLGDFNLALKLNEFM